MEYKTGSYIVKPRKIWTCTSCNQTLPLDIPHLLRVVEYGEEKTNAVGVKYRERNTSRYHVDCAYALNDITDKELQSLKNIKPCPEGVPTKKPKNEALLQSQIRSLLKKYQDKGVLAFYHTFGGLVNMPDATHPYLLGNKGFSDFILFLPNKVYFLEIKTPTGVFRPEQKIFKQLITNLGYEYCIISSMEDLQQLLVHYLIGIPRVQEPILDTIALKNVAEGA